MKRRSEFGAEIAADNLAQPAVEAHYLYDTQVHEFVGKLLTPMPDVNYVPTPSRHVL